MSIGRKIYYELSTGDVILTTLEKASETALLETQNIINALLEVK